MDDKVDTLNVLGVLFAGFFEDGFGSPVTWVDDVCDALRVFEPPTVAFVTMKVEADVAISDPQVGDDKLSLRNLVQLDHQSIDQLARLGIDVGLNVEHREGLPDATLSKDVRKLSVHLHVKVYFFPD